MESNFEENIDLTNEYRIKILPDPIGNKDAASKNYIGNAIDETSLVRKNQYDDFNNQNLTAINSISLNTQAVNDNQVLNDQNNHEENQRS